MEPKTYLNTLRKTAVWGTDTRDVELVAPYIAQARSFETTLAEASFRKYTLSKSLSVLIEETIRLKERHRELHFKLRDLKKRLELAKHG